jgi:hypothetical protein
MGERASEKSMKPMMMGFSRLKPKAEYRELLLMKTEKRLKMYSRWACRRD